MLSAHEILFLPVTIKKLRDATYDVQFVDFK